MEFEGFSFTPSLQQNDDNSMLNNQNINQQQQFKDFHETTKNNDLHIQGLNQNHYHIQEYLYQNNDQYEHLRYPTLQNNNHQTQYINQNSITSIQDQQQFMQLPVECFDSYTHIQSSHVLIPANQPIQQSGSSHTLNHDCQNNQNNIPYFNQNQMETAHQWDDSCKQQEEFIQFNNSNDSINDESSSTEEQQPKSQLVIQRINQFKYPDMKYETAQLNYRENYYVIGDLYINVNMYLDGVKKNRRDKSSIWNHIRPVNLIENNVKGFVSIVVDDTQAAYEDFDRIIALLNKQFSQHAQQQAQWLIQYKKYLFNLDKTRKRFFDEYSHNVQLVKQKIILNTLKSIEMADEILSNQYGGENDYILYTFRRINSENLSQTLYKGGMSKAMVKLIYINEENFRVDTLRNGMLELFSYEGYESVNYSYIFGNFESQERQQHRKFTIFTIDELEVELEMEEIPYQLSKVSLLGGTWFSDQMRVYKFTVSPQQLFQLSIQRKELSNLTNDCLYKNTEYYQKSEKFVKRFYNIHTNPSKN